MATTLDNNVETALSDVRRIPENGNILPGYIRCDMWGCSNVFPYDLPPVNGGKGKYCSPVCREMTFGTMSD